MKTKIIYLLLCSSMLLSCDYYKEKKAREEAIKIEETRKEQEAIAKQKAIEEQEKKMQDIKNDIAKYVHIQKKENVIGWKYVLFNDTDYTIDEVEYEIDETVRKKEFYVKAQSSVTLLSVELFGSRNSNANVKSCKIISVKCKVLGIN